MYSAEEEQRNVIICD